MTPPKLLNLNTVDLLLVHLCKNIPLQLRYTLILRRSEHDWSRACTRTTVEVFIRHPRRPIFLFSSVMHRWLLATFQCRDTSILHYEVGEIATHFRQIANSVATDLPNTQSADDNKAMTNVEGLLNLNSSQNALADVEMI